jgi:FAD/FMN-containing dehydrogenase
MDSIGIHMSGMYQSWGRYPAVDVLSQEVENLYNIDNISLNQKGGKLLLPFGNGRSYGDSCLNIHEKLLDTRGLDRFISFDKDAGILRCESGVLLSKVIELISPHGWFLKVTPGTRFVTIGGAIANDVHGKNHHRAGTFGCHVNCFELLRSDGSSMLCSRDDNSDYFKATIGGLGLTGVIAWAEITLQKVESEFLDVETICFDNLSEFFSISKSSDEKYEHTVAWIDCLAKGGSIGNGLFFRANYKKESLREKKYSEKYKSVPCELPFSIVNKSTLSVFNKLYKWKNCKKNNSFSVQHIYQFFYPLDSIKNWNRIYGSNGFFQYQCVVPRENSYCAIKDILKEVSNYGAGSFLAVLKNFGDIKSPGMLSFPRFGTTLALDFPNQGEKTLNLLNSLDGIVMSAGGAIYPAKDARMSGTMFKKSFEKWNDFAPYIDPNFSSSFLRRVLKDD